MTTYIISKTIQISNEDIQQVHWYRKNILKQTSRELGLSVILGHAIKDYCDEIRRLRSEFGTATFADAVYEQEHPEAGV